MIYFNQVFKIYSADSVALKDINLTIESKEFVSLVGRSGAGKSTLLKILLAEEAPSKGEVFFESVNIHYMSKRKLPLLRRKIGMVFQDFRLLSGKTVFENIAFAMEASGRSTKDIEENIPYVLDLVGLTDKSHRFPHELSGGEGQRVAIARAIINRPDVVVADEPTGNLDPENTREIIRILEKINELGTTIILATHNKGVIDSLGKRVITLEDGKIIRDDKKGKYTL
ncbi:MAG: cell division ATP-binding protein FtsE [bacterium]|nr:cell division ATP-binding protein FtsE [bacterium]